MTDSEKPDLLLSDMQDMKAEMQELKRRTTSIELHLENTTDKNIQLLAENFIELTNKLNLSMLYYNPVHSSLEAPDFSVKSATHWIHFY